jgi:hypothetical protein
MTVRTTFWDRRKQAVQAEARQEAEAHIADEEAEVLALQEQKSDDVLLQELGLPDPDTLLAGDDFSIFMAKAVPARLRNRALRRLWRSNPVLANLDDLVDYGDDFTDASLSGEAIRTSYQVGKGLMKHIEELTRNQEEFDSQSEPEAAEDVLAAEPEDIAETARGTPLAPVEDEIGDAEPTPAPPRRRMRFVVGGTAQELRS